MAAMGTEWMRQQETLNPRMNPAIVVEQAASYPGFPNVMKVTTYPDIANIMIPVVDTVLNNQKTPAQAMGEVVQALVDQSLH